ncbi:iron-sulfur cluster assembly scaffold protein [Mycoplasmopsis agassizii]|uniref:Iron-sulfur cluster assembly scaffold protein n=1 Tax=Mycoplasmopsis agassizii TaxID=33922 RepID=A0ABX4H5V7_9BACT|nr:iron-sulfur cluster assembly scaffold protein [Mycoplasmopsis agassizii]PAF55275.1 iron-sulfur cluster assembly scaffold protein [Mycoplasmopsis agassizii]SMC15693.1 nitrogen fixation protein NifU [Mycoplasmopsis agassizii]
MSSNKKYSRDEARNIIMKNYSSQELENKNLNHENAHVQYSDTCADKLIATFEIENNIIKNIETNLSGCAIFKSSSKLFFKTILNKSLEEVEQLNEEYKKMIDGKDYDQNLMGILSIFDDVKKHFNRHSCAVIVSNFIDKKILKK